MSGLTDSGNVTIYSDLVKMKKSTRAAKPGVAKPFSSLGWSDDDHEWFLKRFGALDHNELHKCLERWPQIFPTPPVLTLEISPAWERLSIDGGPDVSKLLSMASPSVKLALVNRHSLTAADLGSFILKTAKVMAGEYTGSMNA